MSPPAAFGSWFGPYFLRFVALKQACGAQYETEQGMLRRFDRYLIEHVPSPPLGRLDVLQYVGSLSRMTPRARDNVVTVVWQAIAFATRHGASADVLPSRPIAAPPWLHVRPPRILSVEEIRALVAAARALPPATGMRSATCATLLGLLCATGLRIGEALGLDVGDVDAVGRLLTVRRGKFGKSRVVPLLDSTVAALDRYVHSGRPTATPPNSSLFVNRLGRRVKYQSAARAFKQACHAAGLGGPRAPRLHDLRHTFAVRRVVAWYTTGADVDGLLPALSTYLGHVSVENTRTYLRANGLLLDQARIRFEAASSALDRVLP